MKNAMRACCLNARQPYVTLSPCHLVTPSPCHLVIVCCLLLSAGCSGHVDPAPIWGGQVATLSGPDKRQGEAASRGIRLAVEEFNKDLSKLSGRALKIIHSDAHGSPAAFEAEAVRLVSINRVSFLLGGATIAEVERLDRAGVPLITPLGPPERRTNENTFWTGIGANQHGKILAQFVAENLAFSAIATIHDNREDASGEVVEVFAREFTATWAKKDAKTTATLRRFHVAKDTKPDELAKSVETAITQDGLKALIFAGKVDDARHFAGVSVPIIFAGESASISALSAARSPGKEIYLVTPIVFDRAEESEMPKAAEFAKRYKEAFHEPPDVQAGLAYEGMKLVHAALGQVKDTLTPTRLREELLKLKDIPGLAGPLSFTPERVLRRTVFLVRIDDGGTKIMKKHEPQ